MSKCKTIVGNFFYNIYDFICCWIYPSIITFAFFITPILFYLLNWGIFAHILFGATMAFAVGILLTAVYNFIASFPQENVTMRNRAIATWIYIAPATIIATLIVICIQTR